jgi:hypothetical protein
MLDSHLKFLIMQFIQIHNLLFQVAPFTQSLVYYHIELRYPFLTSGNSLFQTQKRLNNQVQLFRYFVNHLFHLYRYFYLFLLFLNFLFQRLFLVNLLGSDVLFLTYFIRSLRLCWTLNLRDRLSIWTVEHFDKFCLFRFKIGLPNHR